MSNEEAKRIVTDGLKRRKADRQMAEQEAQLDQYEQDMIDACNANCADAKFQRQLKETGRLSRQQAESRRAARAEAQAKAQAREDAAVAACRYYGLSCMGILWLAAVTRLPLWAGAALALGLAVILAVYIFRLYFPIER